LLVVPSFYDSIESASERMRTKIQARSLRYPAALSLVVTLLEALATLLLLRFVWRSVQAGSARLRRRSTV
jgi:HAE1 family hydrophobic/amphiphilic exporter-1